MSVLASLVLALVLLLVRVPALEAAVIITPPGGTCAADPRLTAPVTGQDFCFQSTTNTLLVWVGAAWSPISFTAFGTATIAGNLALIGQGADVVGNFLSTSTTAPAIVGQATGFYAGSFFNITDAGSDLANASNIGVVGQSVYSNAGYYQQGGAPGSPGDTLQRNNIYPALFATRVISNLNGFHFTAPVFRIDDTTTSTGILMDAKRAGTVVLGIASDGTPFFAAPAGTQAGSPEFRPTATNGGLVLFNNVASGDATSTPIWFGGKTTAGNIGNVSIESAQATGAVRPDMIFRTGGATQVAFGTERLRITVTGAVRYGAFVFATIGTVLTVNGEIGYCSDCTQANPCAGGGPGAIAKRLGGVNVCN